MGKELEQACMVGDEIVSLPIYISDLTAHHCLFSAIVIVALFSALPTPGSSDGGAMSLIQFFVLLGMMVCVAVIVVGVSNDHR